MMCNVDSKVLHSFYIVIPFIFSGRAVACDGDDLEISCPEGREIFMYPSTMYGRSPNQDECGVTTADDCEISGSFEVSHN